MEDSVSLPSERHHKGPTELCFAQRILECNLTQEEFCVNGRSTLYTISLPDRFAVLPRTRYRRRVLVFPSSKNLCRAVCDPIGVASMCWIDFRTPNNCPREVPLCLVAPPRLPGVSCCLRPRHIVGSGRSRQTADLSA